jgi:excisionase family DNA binding protein
MTKTPLTPPTLLTSEEAAKYLGISARTLARLREGNKIGYYLIGHRIYRYSEEHLVSYINNQYRGPALARSIPPVERYGVAGGVVGGKPVLKSIFIPPKMRVLK